MRSRNPTKFFAKRDAFTLLELLVVCLIVAVLASLSLGVFKGVQEQSKIALARAELAALEACLENYRADNGDYPAVPYEYSAMGGSKAKGSGVVMATQDGEAGNLMMVSALVGDGGNNNWLDPTRFTTLTSPTGGGHEPTDPYDFSGTVIVDPWERVYQYFYDPGSEDWRGFYVLYSRGPGGNMHSRKLGRHTPPSANGAYDPADPKNLDNIYGSGY